jgi:hypothetical protein
LNFLKGIELSFLDIVQERVCHWTGVWCEEYFDHQPEQPRSPPSTKSSKKSEKVPSSSGNEYENADITNSADFEIRKELDKADKLIEQVL